jgi:hypothetical protein
MTSTPGLRPPNLRPTSADLAARRPAPTGATPTVASLPTTSVSPMTGTHLARPRPRTPEGCIQDPSRGCPGDSGAPVHGPTLRRGGQQRIDARSQVRGINRSDASVRYGHHLRVETGGRCCPPTRRTPVASAPVAMQTERQSWRKSWAATRRSDAVAPGRPGTPVLHGLVIHDAPDVDERPGHLPLPGGAGSERPGSTSCTRRSYVRGAGAVQRAGEGRSTAELPWSAANRAPYWSPGPACRSSRPWSASGAA